MEKEFVERELKPRELALRWRLCVGTLKNWRTARGRNAGMGIPFNKRGWRVTYYLSEVLKYEQENEIIPE